MIRDYDETYLLTNPSDCATKMNHSKIDRKFIVRKANDFIAL